MHLTSPLRGTAIVLVLLLAGLSAGAIAGVGAVDRSRDPYASLERFARVLTVIETDYVDEVDPDDLVVAAIDGMADSLDPHTRWLRPDEAQNLQDEAAGSYEGIGVEVRPAPDGVVVSRVLAGGPAERDGIQPGDVIVEVDGASLEGLSLDEVSTRLQGPRGDEVLLEVLRDASVLEIATVRDKVHVPSVGAELLAPGIAYARITQFQKGTAIELDEAVRRLGSVEGLVLDLRDNPGGLLAEAVSTVDLFVDEGVIVSTRGRVEGTLEHTATPGGLGTDLPLALLVNGGSASASEIVAGALQDIGRAPLVGTHTYGKGSVQTLYQNRDGSALKLTIALYYTPSGEPIAAGSGRVPDHVVPYLAPGPLDALVAGIAAAELSDDDRAELLELARAVPCESEPMPIDWDTPAVERLARDPQLQRALELVSR